MFTDETRREIAAIAADLELEPETLLAIAEVESGGKGFATVGGRSEPLIRFEGHYFDRRLSPANRQRARADGLASPAAGAVANPRTQAGRWALLEKACAIDARAANESVSWGIGQVMGAHWAWLGYADVDALVAEARCGIAGQVGLAEAVRGRDWEAFARGYNGPQYRRYGYHRKLAAAYHRFRAESEEPLPEKRNTALRIAKGPVRKALPATAIPTKTQAVRPAKPRLWSRLAQTFSSFLGRA
jgi:hypothetical protein